MMSDTTKFTQEWGMFNEYLKDAVSRRNAVRLTGDKLALAQLDELIIKGRRIQLAMFIGSLFTDRGIVSVFDVAEVLGDSKYIGRELRLMVEAGFLIKATDAYSFTVNTNKVDNYLNHTQVTKH